MPTVKRKAFAYITHGNRLLVFRHPHAQEAGIQVPAGSIRDGEYPDEAVMREAFEETGLTDLVLIRPLGEDMRDRSDRPDVYSDEVHHRFFYHLRCTSDPPPTWQHYETDPSDGGTESILFEFFWAELPDGVPTLIAGHGNRLPELIESLSSTRLVSADDG